MKAFVLEHADTPHDAMKGVVAPGAAIIAGGIDFLQLWKSGLIAPDRVIDIADFPWTEVERREGSLRLGALTRLADATNHPALDGPYAGIGEALRATASTQIRNMATIGGNLMQRTRCVYFRDATLPCNKHASGSGCPARNGEGRATAIFGGGPHCVAVHASDLAVALVAFDASLTLTSASAERSMRLRDFYLQPVHDAVRETQLQPGELIRMVEVSANETTRSVYLKVRDRAAFDFAVVSLCAVINVVENRIENVSLVAGGVGTVPWRLATCEAVLAGRSPSADLVNAAAEALECGAPVAGNAFKLGVLKRMIVRAITQLTERR
jgi:xanthine dehydrogenase YagS FAD-binding subunit